MANTIQAKKRARQAENNRKRNASARSMLRTYVKLTLKAIQSGVRADAISAFQKATPIIDRMARKGLIHKNKAARSKSRLNDRIRVLSA